MPLRFVALAVGIAQLLRPRAVVEFWMALATDDDVSLRPWVYAAARIEGLVLVLWALRRVRSE